jgi:hypothetical protein
VQKANREALELGPPLGEPAASRVDAIPASEGTIGPQNRQNREIPRNRQILPGSAGSFLLVPGGNTTLC